MSPSEFTFTIILTIIFQFGFEKISDRVRYDEIERLEAKTQGFKRFVYTPDALTVTSFIFLLFF